MKEEEINISSLLKLIAKGIKNHFLLILIAGICGAIIGYAVYSFKTPIYKTSAIFQSTLLHPFEVQSTVKQLNDELNNSSTKFEALNFCKRIEIIAPSNIKPAEDNLEINKKHFITIEVETVNPEVSNKMGDELVSYFKSNSKLREILESRKAVLTKHISRLENKLSDKTRNNLKNVTIQEMSQSEKSLYTELAEVELALSEISILKEIKSFYTPTNRVSSPSLFIIIGALVIVSFTFIIRWIIRS
jgi:chaperonin cofactor prefoldin